MPCSTLFPLTSQLEQYAAIQKHVKDVESSAPIDKNAIKRRRGDIAEQLAKRSRLGDDAPEDECLKAILLPLNKKAIPMQGK
jgi:hypothetical protein